MARSLLLVVALLVGAAAGGGQAGDAVEVHLFWLRTCPHCAEARAFLQELADDVPQVVVLEHEVSTDPVEQQRFVDMAAERGEAARAVPTIIVGDDIWVGFGPRTGDEIRAAVEALSGGAEPEVRDEEIVEVPIVGDVDVASTSLVVATVVIGIVDGVNPCSLWVLSILLALVLHSGSRRRVLLVGSTFLAVTTALYGLYVVGAYSLLSYASYLSWIQRAVAGIVGVLAIINIRDYLRAGEPATLAIPERAKPGIYRRARGLIAPERSPLAVLAGTAALAVGVSLVETPCSAALPVLWTNLLSANEVGTATAVSLFGLYMALFLVDELVLFGAAVVTMRATKLQERHGRALRLVTGTVMLGLAGAMLVDPALLTDLDGTLVVLGGIAAVTALIAVVAPRVGQSSQPRAPRRVAS